LAYRPLVFVSAAFLCPIRFSEMKNPLAEGRGVLAVPP
jgi:hypothetical protein